MNNYDEFIEHLEAALESPEGREDFIAYLQNLTREERAELLAEAARRDPKGASEQASETNVS
ncbi:MAG: hypothetical protein LC754_01535 [Acidobacteria bacterium]|nr:hypothetical protein [Acidobacteriota bacterium]